MTAGGDAAGDGRSALLQQDEPGRPTSHPPLVADLAALLAAHGDATYREVLRAPTLSLGLFAVGPGHVDTQTTHDQDEVYVVVGGSAFLDVDGDQRPVSVGSVAYVPARVPHRFVDVSDDLRVVVLFAPPLT